MIPEGELVEVLTPRGNWLTATYWFRFVRSSGRHMVKLSGNLGPLAVNPFELRRLSKAEQATRWIQRREAA